MACERKVSRRRDAKGSATVEMAYIMPMFLLLFFFIVMLTFYFHDKCVLYVTAYEAAVVGAQKERLESTYSEEELVNYFHERADDKLIFFPHVSASVEKGLEYISVHAEASRGGWQIHAKANAMRMRTEELIYLKEELQENGNSE